MFINKLNQLYKPKRILYYKEADKNETEALYAGEIPADIEKYSGAFGTYDYPGIFYLSSLKKEVIGIEYRQGDERIDYPTQLESVILDEAFFYSIEIDSDFGADADSIREIFKKVAADDDAHRVHSDLSIKDEPDIISVFVRGGKMRILYEANLDQDRAKRIIDGEVDGLDKEQLYKMALFDPITGHFNWNHLVPFLEIPKDAGIDDYAFVHFDIKEFRVINEVYGHIAANNVLSDIVKAMNEADFIYTSARCHNDNFAMMIKDMPIDKTIEKLEAFFERLSYLKDDPNYRIYYRCGVVPMQRAMFAGNRVADAGKLAQALGTGHNRTDIIVYTDEMHDDILWGNYIKAY
ncbi:MAG: GGDEF domain-containing protein, partial [Lachnospiraceae bacterium]|nr:GGDEF domain-containing protein [Lachnospiraceae bacterium]